MRALLLLAMLALSAAPVVFGARRGIDYHQTLDPASVAAEIGFCYTTTVPRAVWPFDVPADGSPTPHVSRLILLEDGRALRPPHQVHADIRRSGGGRFSHWGGTLYFSASDNTDPRINGRRYTLRATAFLEPVVVWGWMGCVLLPFGLASRAQGAAHQARASRVWLRSRPRTTSVVVLGAATLLLPVLVAPGRMVAVGQGIVQLVWIAALAVSFGWAWLAGRYAGQLWVGKRLAWSGRAVAPGSRVIDYLHRLLSAPDWRGRVARAGALSLPWIVFVGVLTTALPELLLGVAYSYALPVTLSFGLLLWLTLRRTGPAASMLSLTVVLTLFALPLAALWQHVATHVNAVGGLLPFSDASGYYYDARRLLDGHPLGWSARRPLFVGVLATVLGLTGQDLRVALALFVALNAGASWLLAREIRSSHGAAAAVVTTMVLFLFYRVAGGTGTLLTENLGFAFGVLGTAVIWRGARTGHTIPVAFGIGVVALGLMARAGSFFVLPAMLVAGAWVFSANRRAWRFVAATTVAMMVAAGLSLGLGRALADPTGGQTAFSNYSYSIYGLVVGGKGWGQVLRDHPQATEGAEIYALALEAFRRNPMGLLEGSARMWAEYLLPVQRHRFHAFAFVGSDRSATVALALCYALSVIGMVVCARRRRRPEYALLGAGVAGHLASIPFVPPIDAGLRVYAATMPLVAVVMAIGAEAAVRAIRHAIAMAGQRPTRGLSSVATSRGDPPWSIAAYVSGGLAVLAFAGPVLAYGSSQVAALETLACPAGQRLVFIRQTRGSFLRVIAGGSNDRVMVPEIQVDDLLRTAGRVEIRNDAERFAAGTTMMNVYDLKGGELLWLVAPTDLLPNDPGILRICGHDSADELSRSYGVFYADAVTRGHDDASVDRGATEEAGDHDR